MAVATTAEVERGPRLGAWQFQPGSLHVSCQMARSEPKLEPRLTLLSAIVCSSGHGWCGFRAQDLFSWSQCRPSPGPEFEDRWRPSSGVLPPLGMGWLASFSWWALAVTMASAS
jgi:hypothetical protein